MCKCVWWPNTHTHINATGAIAMDAKQYKNSEEEHHP